MAYIKTNYPEFKDIRVETWDGFNPGVVLQQVLDFLQDPAHATYRLIDTHVDYFHTRVPPVSSDEPEGDIWVEVSIIYTE
jgi:hypothetical protein